MATEEKTKSYLLEINDEIHEEDIFPDKLKRFYVTYYVFFKSLFC